MVYGSIIKGKYIVLRAVSEEDAAFTSKLRSDISLIKHIHKVDTTIAGQISFITWQRSKDNDYYFIISTPMNEQLGTIALYNMNGKNAELGRWVSYGNAFQNLESVLLLHDFAFDILGLETVYTCTNITNERTINFWKRFGSDECYIEQESDFIASKNVVTKESYVNKIRPRLERLLQY